MAGENGSPTFKEKAVLSASLEDVRRSAIKNIAEAMGADYAQVLGPGGYQGFASPIERVAEQRVNVPMQAAGAYSASAGIGGPVGPAFPGMADLPALLAKVQGFNSYMNMLTGPMAQELAMLDEEALQDWYNQMGKQQMKGGP